jgi:hypothetical protein
MAESVLGIGNKTGAFQCFGVAAQKLNLGSGRSRSVFIPAIREQRQLRTNFEHPQKVKDGRAEHKIESDRRLADRFAWRQMLR